MVPPTLTMLEVQISLDKRESSTDLGKKRSDGEPDEKGNEETQPREVEGSHVRAGEAAKLDLGGSVILIRVDVKGVFGL